MGLYQFIDLSKDFVFSYTYDITRTLQHNMTAASPAVSQSTNQAPKRMYVWNSFIARQFIDALGWPFASAWLVSLVHGAFIQRKCSLFGRIVNLALIARRSRYFAGTRYLKRGISDSGKVANDVEIEQIVHEESVYEGTFSSYVQVRGSIPIYWTQETSVTVPKPPIVLSRIDSTYDATQKHFLDLYNRYSSPINVLDLTKQDERCEREMIVSHEFRCALKCINQGIQSGDTNCKSRNMSSYSTNCDEFQNITARDRPFPDSVPVRYCALDFSNVSKLREMNALESLERIAKWTIWQTQVFCSRPRQLVAPFSCHHEANAVMCPRSSASCFQGARTQYMHQHGVLRTNCIDCLDRTNAAQFAIGARALEKILAVTGVQYLSENSATDICTDCRCECDNRGKISEQYRSYSHGALFVSGRLDFSPVWRI